MNLSTIILIALGLSMDALAVSVANGFINKKQKIYNALRFGLSFGLFQMIMPALGWFGGNALRNFIAGVDHWVAFFLLSLIGIKMIYEAFIELPSTNGYFKKPIPIGLNDGIFEVGKGKLNKIEGLEEKSAEVTWIVLLGLSIATSIDALAAGVTFAFLSVSVVLPVLIIGFITFVVSFLGFLIGTRFGHLFEKKIEILGGLVLIGIGIKILIEGLF